MKMKRFENKIRKEMLKSSMAIILVMVITTVSLLAIFSFSVRSYRLNKTLDKYSNELVQTTSNHKKLLNEDRQNVFIDLLKSPTEINKSQTYGSFYTFNANENVKSDLLVVDDTLDPLMSTNSIFEENYAFLNYLRIVISNIDTNNDDAILRVYRDTSNESYLLYVHPHIEDEMTLGYTVSIINGKEFQLLNEESLANFVITDSYSNVLATNNTQNQLNTGKLNKDFLKGKPYSVKRSDVMGNIEILTYISNETQQNVLLTTIMILLLATFIVFWYTYRFSNKLSTRIGQSLYLFNYELNKVKTVSNHLINIKTDDEFEDLADEVNNMIEDLRESHRKYIELSQLNLTSERRKLEAQFHPHFLANTLETIRSAMYIDTDIANEVLLRMNRLLRYSIDEADQDISLDEDLDYLKNYLTINSVRFDEFDYEIHAEDSLDNLIVPKLFLLPLIENSLKYGFKYRRDLKVKIFILNQNDQVVIRVVDNGNGLAKDEDKSLNEFLKTDRPASQHHGLLNTRRRLDLLYPGSHFRVVSKLNCTVIEIIIKDGRYV